MVQKRPFVTDEMLEVSFKHSKHVETSNQLVSFSATVFPEDSCHTHIPKTSERGCGQGSEDNEKLESFGEVPRGADDSRANFDVAWSTSSTTAEEFISESSVHLPLFPEYFQSDPPFHLPLFSEYFSPEKPFRTLACHEDIYSMLLEHPPRKLVSLGPNHQIDIPEWEYMGATGRPNASDAPSDVGSNSPVGDEAEERLMGTCVIAMPLMESSTIDDGVGKDRTDCSCEDRGSMRCVRQHIVKEREKLLKEFGQEKFVELGLADMGEQVAEKWSAEEEQLFHEVVFNNPASRRKNFWNYLCVAFPSRTKKEIVSYYFNVFMLRKRADQNRNNPLDIDSDNDEWQGSDGNEIAAQEEDEDSVVESPVSQDDTCFTDCHDNDHCVYDDEYAADETCAAANGTVGRCNSNGFCPRIQSQDQTVHQDPSDDKDKDDSCCFTDKVVTSHETRNGDQWCGNYNCNGVSNGYSQGHVLEPCDTEVWDHGFVSFAKSKIDFLPTCHMIEEVFGDGRRQDTRRA